VMFSVRISKEFAPFEHAAVDEISTYRAPKACSGMPWVILKR
jgi:hypothetical protein